jgi:hypothetical protein
MQLTGQADGALLQLLNLLKAEEYHFVTVTPESHRRVLERPDKKVARNLRDIFGWSLPFQPETLPFLHLLEEAGVAADCGDGLMKSLIRVSSLDDRLFLHSAYPTEAEDAVFFGPDSYRFACFLQAELSIGPAVRRLVDIGAGAGVGALSAAPLVPGARLTLSDVNPAALRLAAINARFADVEVELVEGSGLDAVEGPVDLAIANPPFIIDESDRAYRNGGDMHGARLSLDWTLAAARRIEKGGQVLLYTGSAIVDGYDALREALEAALPALHCTLGYRELDPDIFGEELSLPAYQDVERIAAIGAVVEKAR